VIQKERMKFKEELKIAKLDVTRVRETSQKQEAELSSMTQDRNKLRKLKIKLALENVSLKESVDTLKNKVEKLEADHGNAAMEKVSLTESLADYKGKAEKLEAECENLRRGHQEALEKQWDVLEAELKAFESKVEELEAECESVRHDYSSCKLEVSDLARERDECQIALNKSKAILENLEREYNSLQKDHRVINALRVKEQARLKSALEASEKKAKKLEIASATLQKEHEILSAEKSVLLQERDSAHKKLGYIEVQNVELGSSIEYLRNELEKATKERSKLGVGDDILLVQDVVNLRALVSSLQVDLATATKEKKRLHGMEVSLKQELKKLTEELALMKTKNVRIDAPVKEKDEMDPPPPPPPPPAVMAVKEDTRQVHTVSSSSADAATAVKGGEDTKRDQQHKLKQQVKGLESQSCSTKRELDTAGNEKSCLTLKEASVSKGIIQLQEEISSMKGEVAMALKEKERACSAEFGYLETIHSLNQKLACLVKEKDQMMAEKLFLKQEQDDLHAVISILEGERDALKEQLEVNEGATRVDLDMTENNGKAKIATELSSGCQLDELMRTMHSLNKQLELSTKESEKLLFQNEALVQEDDKLQVAFSLSARQKDAAVTKKLKPAKNADIHMMDNQLGSAAKAKEKLALFTLSLKQQLAELTRRHSIKLEPTEVTEERDQVLLGKDHFCLQDWEMLFEIISRLSEDRCAPMKTIEINHTTELSDMKKETLVIFAQEKKKVDDSEISLHQKLDELICTTVNREAASLDIVPRENDGMPPLKTDTVVMEHNNLNGTVCELEMAKDVGVKGLEQKLPKKEHVDMNKRLAHAVVEQDNARPQVAEMQVLLSNQQLPQNPDIHIKTLHTKNRCLRHANVCLSRLSLKSYI
jgi:chromosome segregation ATPase